MTIKDKLFFILISLAIVALWGSCEHQSADRNIKLSQTHFLLGDDYLRKKMPDAAKQELFASLELNAENQDALQLLGIVFFMEGLQKMNILEHEQCLKGAAAEEETKEANNDFHRSEEYLRKAMTIGDRNKRIDSDGLNYLANIALHFKQYDEAISLSKKALGNLLFSSRYLLLGTLGWSYYNKGDKRSAARELRQAVYQEPKFCVGRFRLAKVYFDEKAFDEVIEELNKVVDDAACPIQEAYQLLGLSHYKKKNSEQARELFEKCIKLNPKSCIAEECNRYLKIVS